MRTWGARWRRIVHRLGSIFGLVAVVVFGTSSPTRGVVEATGLPAVLATSVAECYGLTARLSLLTADDGAAPLPSGAVRGVRWRLELSGLPGAADTPSGTASLDSFTIRGDRAARADLALLRWTGTEEELSAQGLILLPSLDGSIQREDQGRIFAFIQTAHAVIGLRGIIFPVQVSSAGLSLHDPIVLPQEPCSPLATPTITQSLDLSPQH